MRVTLRLPFLREVQKEKWCQPDGRRQMARHASGWALATLTSIQLTACSRVGPSTGAPTCPCTAGRSRTVARSTRTRRRTPVERESSAGVLVDRGEIIGIVRDEHVCSCRAHGRPWSGASIGVQRRLTCCPATLCPYLENHEAVAHLRQEYASRVVAPLVPANGKRVD